MGATTVTVRESIRRVRRVVVRPGAAAAEQTTAAELLRHCGRGAIVTDNAPGKDESFALSVDAGPAPQFNILAGDTDSWSLTASHGALLYAAMRLLVEEWGDAPVDQFRKRVTRTPAFPWLRNLSDFLVGSLRGAEGFDREGYCCQLARQGFTHVTINGLGAAHPFESGPPGDVYHWFYDYSPDLDQYVDSELLRGAYPRDYLAANLAFLRSTAQCALKYGLTPGLHINSPRSMPEAFWSRYGFLRGARVDHPRETLLPRYTLAMAHPVVQNHYRELVRNIMAEIPEIGFIHLWTNDSGSGFEFVSTLYAGRNGGPYLIREWKGHQEIARVAGRNVLTYFHLLRDEGRRVNPEFRLVCDLGPFADERPTVIAGMGGGIDSGDFAYFEGGVDREELQQLRAVGAETHAKVEVSENNVLGVPFPRLVHERLSTLRARDGEFILTGGTPASLAPFDINREVVRAFQLMPESPLGEILAEWSRRWGGGEADRLREVWDLSDRAVRAVPPGVPMSTFGYPWFRLWVRPFVPDIDGIPEAERLYYERYLLATFNNPARIDLNNDMMWNFLAPDEAGEKKRAYDRGVLPLIDSAVALCTAAGGTGTHGESQAVFADARDRLRAARAFHATLRNMMAWTESVHGYLRGGSDAERERYRGLAREMVTAELENSRALLSLVRTTEFPILPILAHGETLHGYGKNFADLLERKIHLMEKFGDRAPRVDPGYMWRMPPGMFPGV